MADTKISQLPAATTPLSGAEVVPLVQSGATVQTPVNDLSLLTAATANTFTANQIISVTDNTNAALRVTQLGTGNAILVEDSTNPDSTPFMVTAAGDVGIGKTPAVDLDVEGQIRATDSTVDLRMLPISASGAAIFGAISNHSLVFFQNNAEAARIDTSKNFLITSSGGLGYGTGSGGTVTQLTSKGTGVTLNKTNGAITTNNSALGAGATATFTVFSTSMAATDTVLLNVTNGNYSARIFNNAAGSFAIALKNETAGSLSDAVQINFTIIKAVTS